MAERAVILKARRLRKSLTGPEVILWLQLRDRQLEGLRFRRQVPLGAFVVDFACLSIRLIVEIDGGVHDLRTFDDARRDDWLRSQGFRVIRFTNGDVRNRLNYVLAEIRRHAPSPLLGGRWLAERDGWGFARPEMTTGNPDADRPHPAGSACHLPPRRG